MVIHMFDQLAGAKGYLTKDCSEENLIAAMNNVYIGQTYLSPVASELLVNRVINEVNVYHKMAQSTIDENGNHNSRRGKFKYWK